MWYWFNIARFSFIFYHTTYRSTILAHSLQYDMRHRNNHHGHICWSSGLKWSRNYIQHQQKAHLVKSMSLFKLQRVKKVNKSLFGFTKQLEKPANFPIRVFVSHSWTTTTVDDILTNTYFHEPNVLWCNGTHFCLKAHTNKDTHTKWLTAVSQPRRIMLTPCNRGQQTVGQGRQEDKPRQVLLGLHKDIILHQ